MAAPPDEQWRLRDASGRVAICQIERVPPGYRLTIAGADTPITEHHQVLREALASADRHRRSFLAHGWTGRFERP